MNVRRVFMTGVLGVTAAAACSMLPNSSHPITTGEPPALSPRAPRSIAFKQPLAIDWDRSSDRDFLTEIAPRTLATGRRVLLGRQGTQAVALSPDRERLLAVGQHGGYRLIEVDAMRELATFRLSDRGWPVAVRWMDPDRALVIRGSAKSGRISVVDPVSRTTVSRTLFEGSPSRVRGAAGGFVVLAHQHSIHDEHLPVRLVVVDAAGVTRSVALERIVAGFSAGEGNRFGRTLVPALATRGDEAIVVATDGTVAVVDLSTLEVSYPEPQRSLIENITAALLPAAHAKFSEGTSLWARWIDDRYLALTGSRSDMRGRGENMRMQSRCLPIRLLDTRDWSLQDWEGTGNGLEVIDGAIITFDRCADEEQPGGLTAYDDEGHILWRALNKKNISGVTVRGSLAFVRHGYERVLRSVVDVRSGRVLTTRQSFAAILPY